MTTFTYEDVKEAIVEAVVTFPDRVNPQDEDESCVYTSEEDPSHHCIAGQVLASFSLDLPPTDSAENVGNVGGLDAAEAFTHDALLLLDTAQRVFDNVRTAHGKLIDERLAGPLPWSTAYDRLREIHPDLPERRAQ